MTNLESRILEIKGELVPLSVTREEFLAQCACEKIRQRSITYNQKFDEYLIYLDKSEKLADLPRITQTLTGLSSLLLTSYESLIKDLEYYEKNLFNKKD